MRYQNGELSSLLSSLDLGSPVAESDLLLETARIETSAFTDLLNDRVDLVPGTKGSGKSALFRIFVDFLPEILLKQHKVVVAHGVETPGDPVFHAFIDRFSELTEEEFVSFWCIYLVSLAQEQFIKGTRYTEFLSAAHQEVQKFRVACANANIPEIKAKKSLRDILEWTLNGLRSWRPKLSYRPPDASGEWELDLFGSQTRPTSSMNEEKTHQSLPLYVNEIKESLEAVLKNTNLSLWLMVDKLDEIFPRRSQVERTALRGLLRAMRYFSCANIRVKIFLRDDMLEQIVRADEGYTALTHVTARQADTLRWTQDQILAMVVKRFSADAGLRGYLRIDQDQLDASANYRAQCFDMIFPPAVYRGPKQSPTIRWVYNRCADGNGAVTPRDVLELLIRARQKQADLYAADPEGASDWIIGPAAIRYGFQELSKRKRDTYLKAEFPHLWENIEKFSGGKTNYTSAALRNLLGTNWKTVADNLSAIGFFSRGSKKDEEVFSIPFLYRHGLDLTQGKA